MLDSSGMVRPDPVAHEADEGMLLLWVRRRVAVGIDLERLSRSLREAVSAGGAIEEGEPVRTGQRSDLFAWKRRERGAPDQRSQGGRQVGVRIGGEAGLDRAEL